MSLIKFTLLKQFSIPRLLNRDTFRIPFKYASTKVSTEEIDEDKPIPYTQTPALHWQAKFTRVGTDKTRLSYEPTVIVASLSALLIYFCILREENDIDLEFDKTLYDRIEGLEEQQIRTCITYNEINGLPTKELKNRLAKIIKNKQITE